MLLAENRREDLEWCLAENDALQACLDYTLAAMEVLQAEVRDLREAATQAEELVEAVEALLSEAGDAVDGPLTSRARV